MDELYEKLFGSSAHPCDCYGDSQPRIFRLPEYIYKLHPSAYTPQVVSLGPLAPFHFDAKQRENADKVKCGTARHLLSEHSESWGVRPEVSLESCHQTITERIEDIRALYKLSSTDIGEAELAELMLLDGLFIVHVLLMGIPTDRHTQRTGNNVHVNEPNPSRTRNTNAAMAPFGNNAWTKKLICYDLLKVENQIPWFVLELLCGILFPRVESSTVKRHSLQSLMENMELDVSTQTERVTTFHPEPVHLLDLFRDFLVRGCTGVRPPAGGSNTGETKTNYRVPTAVALKMASIKFRKRKSSKGFLDISFNDGVLEIPPIRTSDYTCALFRNLIAYEQLRPYGGGRNHITAYLVLMDCLVDTVEDVSLLRCNGIIENRLNSDQAAANLINNLKHHGPYALDRNCLEGVFLEVNKFYINKYKSRWEIMTYKFIASGGLLMGLLMVVLTIIQTFFTVLAYYIQDIE